MAHSIGPRKIVLHVRQVIELKCFRVPFTVLFRTSLFFPVFSYFIFPDTFFLLKSFPYNVIPPIFLILPHSKELVSPSSQKLFPIELYVFPPLAVCSFTLPCLASCPCILSPTYKGHHPTRFLSLLTPSPLQEKDKHRVFLNKFEDKYPPVSSYSNLGE